MNKQTHIVNSGTGKTTIMTGLFYKMKKLRYSVEFSQEVAKSYVYEERYEALKCQPYISSDQLWNIEKLIGKVDYIVTDSPFILACIYGPLYTGNKYPENFYKSMIEYHKTLNSFNFLLKRGFPYETEGRIQTEYEADKIYEDIKLLLIDNNLIFDELEHINSDRVVDIIFEKITNF